MADYLSPTACKNEKKAFEDAKKAFETSLRNYRSAQHNMQAGGVATGAAGVVAIGCLFAATGIGAVICLGGAGAGMISGELWTLSAGEALINAEEALEVSMTALEEAIRALCVCADANTVSIPD